MTDAMVGMVDAIDAGGGNLFVDMKKDRGGPSLGQYWTFLAKTFFRDDSGEAMIQARVVEVEVDGCGKISSHAGSLASSTIAPWRT